MFFHDHQIHSFTLMKGTG